MNKHAINNVKKNVKEITAWDAHPSSKPCRKLLDLSERSSGSKHRLMWRSLRIRTKISVKSRLPRSRHIHFRFGSKSLFFIYWFYFFFRFRILALINNYYIKKIKGIVTIQIRKTNWSVPSKGSLRLVGRWDGPASSIHPLRRNGVSIREIRLT